MRSPSRWYDELRAFCAQVPLVDCHDHTGACGPRYTDPVQVVIGGYFLSDLQSASSEQEMALVQDSSRPLAERWPVLERAWRRTCHTGYAQVTRRVLREFYGEAQLTLEALERMAERLPDLSDPQVFDGLLARAGIAARLEDMWPDPAKVLDRSLVLSPRGRLVASLPGLHGVRDAAQVQAVAAPLGRWVTCLDEYLDVLRQWLTACRDYGAVALKDQSAYSRSLAYGNPARAEAEAVFNWFMEDPRRSAAYPDQTQPLDDFLFHALMRLARGLDLPVQVHTGHMAGIRNDIAKTRAVGLTRVLELHREVRFDLFHANWPHGDELLFLGKNYPNVALDFCWANIIDPVYCQRLFQQVVSCVPHGKVHGYGSDYGGYADRAWAHAQIARDNIASALAELVERDYLDLDAAREIAAAWLFDNPNGFFRLQLTRD